MVSWSISSPALAERGQDGLVTQMCGCPAAQPGGGGHHGMWGGGQAKQLGGHGVVAAGAGVGGRAQGLSWVAHGLNLQVVQIVTQPAIPSKSGNPCCSQPANRKDQNRD